MVIGDQLNESNKKLESEAILGAVSLIYAAVLHRPMTVAAFHLAGFSSGRPQYSFRLYSCISMSLTKLPTLETEPMENSH